MLHHGENTPICLGCNTIIKPGMARARLTVRVSPVLLQCEGWKPGPWARWTMTPPLTYKSYFQPMFLLFENVLGFHA